MFRNCIVSATWSSQIEDLFLRIILDYVRLKSTKYNLKFILIVSNIYKDVTVITLLGPS